MASGPSIGLTAKALWRLYEAGGYYALKSTFA